MAEHDLKSYPVAFRHIASGRQTFDIRWGGEPDKRIFAEGDTLRLREYIENRASGYTGNECIVRVTYIADISRVRDGYVAMSIKREGPLIRPTLDTQAGEVVISG